MELHDAGVELVGEVRHVRRLIAAGGYHDVVRLEPVIICDDDESVGILGDRFDLQTPSHRKIKSGGVRLEVVGHLVLRWATAPRPGKLQTRQGAEVRGREQLQRVPTLAPGVAGPLIGVQDHKRPVSLGKVVADGKAGLAAADDDGLDLLGHATKVGGSTSARHR